MAKQGTPSTPVGRVVNNQGRAFNVVLVRSGDRYGLKGALVHESSDPMVEFYDAKYENDARFDKGRGQFVSRYYLSTLANREGGRGLDLGYSPEWKLTGQNVDDAIAAVEAALSGGSTARHHATMKRPALRKLDRVTLAPHKSVIPPYDGKPFVLRDTVLTVSHLTGTGSKRSPWHVVVTDGTHFWHLEPDDVVRAEDEHRAHSTTKRHHSTMKSAAKSPAQLNREIAVALVPHSAKGDRVLADLKSWGIDREQIAEVREAFRAGNPRRAMALARDLGWNRASKRGRAFR